MGAQILIRLESDRYDESNLAPFLGRDFFNEISRGALWKDIEVYFLNKKEIKLLEAPNTENFENEFASPINPKELKLVFLKIKKFLQEYEDLLPFDIVLDIEKMEAADLNYPLMINNSKCWIQGDSNLFEINDKLKIVNHPHEPNEVDLWVNYQEEIVLEDKVYFLKKITRSDKYNDIIVELIKFCEFAIEKNEKIFWLYSH